MTVHMKKALNGGNESGDDNYRVLCGRNAELILGALSGPENKYMRDLLREGVRSAMVDQVTADRYLKANGFSNLQNRSKTKKEPIKLSGYSIVDMSKLASEISAAIVAGAGTRPNLRNWNHTEFCCDAAAVIAIASSVERIKRDQFKAFLARKSPSTAGGFGSLGPGRLANLL